MTYAVILLVTLPYLMSGAIYYVSPNGKDSNRGSETAPFRHLSKAAETARQPGDTVIVFDGEYDNESVLTTSENVRSVVALEHSGASGMPITFRALHRGRAILDAGATSASSCNGAWAYFDLRNSSWIAIQGFVIQHGCYNGIRSNDHAHDVTLTWNEIRNVGNWSNPAGTSSPSGIYLNAAEYNFVFDGNVFHDIGGGSNVNQQHAIYTSASRVVIVNNIFYGMTHGWAIQTAGGDGILIANNTFAFANPHREGQILLWDNEKSGSLANLTIRDNIFYEPVNPAIVTTLRGRISGTCSIDHNLTTARDVYDGGEPCPVHANQTRADPKLMSAATRYDFHLMPGSPAIGAGVPIQEAAWDFDGAPRAAGTATDIGALAFTRAAPQASQGSR